jgi:hypothetical protein
LTFDIGIISEPQKWWAGANHLHGFTWKAWQDVQAVSFKNNDVFAEWLRLGFILWRFRLFLGNSYFVD